MPPSSTSLAGLNFSATSLAGSSVSSMQDPGGAAAAAAECDPARLAALSYPRLAGAAAGGLGPMYSAASYPSTDQNPYPSIAMENSFYGSLVSQRIKQLERRREREGRL